MNRRTFFGLLSGLVAAFFGKTKAEPAKAPVDITVTWGPGLKHPHWRVPQGRWVVDDPDQVLISHQPFHALPADYAVTAQPPKCSVLEAQQITSPAHQPDMPKGWLSQWYGKSAPKGWEFWEHNKGYIKKL